ATQNPIEQEGTYPLPEAQVDRFLLKLQVGYPSRDEERIILERMAGRIPPRVNPVLGPEEIRALRGVVNGVFVDEKVKDYVLDLVFATREPAAYGLDAAHLIAYGASPRATLALTQASRARALLAGRSFVVPEDVKTTAHAALRHRILITYEAEAERLTSDEIIDRLLDHVEVP
ncbi:MoxR family ATPase, partial [bacterium]|nr:MoxR family ATPase [bacterium]